MPSLLEDPYFVGLIDEVIDENRHALTARQANLFREVMASTFEDNAIARKALDRSRPPHVGKSGEQLKEGAMEADEPVAKTGER